MCGGEAKFPHSVVFQIRSSSAGGRLDPGNGIEVFSRYIKRQVRLDLNQHSFIPKIYKPPSQRIPIANSPYNKLGQGFKYLSI